MFEGLYNSASGMITQAKVQEVISNNIAKANIAGYKRLAVVCKPFENELNDNIKNPYSGNGQTNGVDIEGIYTIHQQGRLKNSPNPLDLAIEGEGFFTVELNDKNYYTRNGSFAVDNEGYLVTSEGLSILGDSGKVKVFEKSTANPSIVHKVFVDDDGTISVQKSDSTQNIKIGKLLISKFEDQSKLQPMGQSLFMAEGQEAQTADKFAVKQYSLEESNVNIIDEMVSMISNMRVYEANQRNLRNMSDTYSRAISEISKL